MDTYVRLIIEEFVLVWAIVVETNVGLHCDWCLNILFISKS